MLLQCIANMATCKENIEILQPTIPLVVKRLNSSLDMERTVAFQALTNLSYTITRSQVESILPAIPVCMKWYIILTFSFYCLRIFLKKDTVNIVQNFEISNS